MKSHVGAVFFAISTLTVAQPVKVRHPVQPSSNRYEQLPFDATREQLPPHFEGHDVQALYGALHTPPKGEYETSAAYNERLEAVRTKRLYGSVMTGSAIAVIMPTMDLFKEDETVTWRS